MVLSDMLMWNDKYQTYVLRGLSRFNCDLSITHTDNAMQTKSLKPCTYAAVSTVPGKTFPSLLLDF